MPDLKTNQITIADACDALGIYRFRCTCCGESAREQCADHDDGFGTCDNCLKNYGHEMFCTAPNCPAHQNLKSPLTDTLIALAHFCADYHSGQASRGYRLFCMAQNALARRGFLTVLNVRMTERERRIYEKLVRSYNSIV